MQLYSKERGCGQSARKELIKQDTFYFSVQESLSNLIMGFGICNGLLLVPSVLQDVTDVPHVPVIIRLFLQKFDPHVWNCHAKPVVKSSTAFLYRTAQCRHSRYILWEFLIIIGFKLHQKMHYLKKNNG